MDIPIRPGDESLELGVAHTGIPAAEESKNVKVPRQDNADCVFRQAGVNSQRVCPSGKNCQCRILQRSPSAIAQSRQTEATGPCSTLASPPRQRSGAHSLPRDLLLDPKLELKFSHSHHTAMT